jgi:glyoxylase-like metal-dependent hydrolase (beta-lactamase superfamily II)
MPEAKPYTDEGKNFTVLQLFTPCLAEMAYVISSGEEAVIIDPLREIEVYLTLLKEKGLKLKYIFETHFHADFVSGHYDLSQKTGAEIVFGPNAAADYAIKVATDGEIFKVGSVEIKVIHTPGHTMESSCYLLLDGDRQHCLFTGDTLFLGEVGRPDLAVKSGTITAEDLAGFLYDSLREKVMKLDPQILVYPGHGAGSPCGKKISAGTYCTLGR